jgi:hypothetical protein
VPVILTVAIVEKDEESNIGNDSEDTSDMMVSIIAVD